ncbi:hypothetical protein ACFFX1_24065 [Dactylosporangium sucinum]|uniref:Uncharacterized protein n=1 Tax=Dactylosporangium sucinum TaxID=1424081 RepID=A0A917TYF6_9ACTN|nr:hypothetical protein [Dactylosporangium sucinum]GGM43809.1 hypothetical protein GCM10007977_051730 [Dactylosporangium sucinum]
MSEPSTNLPPDQAAFNRRLIGEFRDAGRRLERRPLLLLTTTGSSSWSGGSPAVVRR